jgi:hypothetical protein
MLNCLCTSKIIPGEYRKAAEALFPQGGGPNRETALAYAGFLGIDAVFRVVLEGPQKEMERFLVSFQNNMDLLIQKTWVEKADEDRKERLQNKIPGFISLIKKGEHRQALEEFVLILEELAWLLFGAQSRKDDFSEYIFRIDTQLGLFWWYGSRIGCFLTEGPWDGETLRTALVLGLCYLTEF